MPAYGTVVAGNQRLIYPGDTFALFSAEQPVSGEASISVQPSYLWARRLTGLSFEIIFSANPGTFNFQIQGADTDSATKFATEGNGTVTTATAMGDGTYLARVELSPWVARWVRLLVSAATQNAVNVTVNVTAQ